MEGLPRDIRHLLVRKYLVLSSLRALLCVSRTYYMIFKFYVKIQVVPFGGAYVPRSCALCDTPALRSNIFGSANVDAPVVSVARLPKRDLERLAPKKGVVECECGHRFLCHVKDGEGGACPKCSTPMKKIKL